MRWQTVSRYDNNYSGTDKEFMRSEAVMPLTRELDPTAGPLDFFGSELRRWRTETG